MAMTTFRSVLSPLLLLLLFISAMQFTAASDQSPQQQPQQSLSPELLGDQAMKDERHFDAVREYTNAIKAEPSATLYQKRAVAYMHRQELQRALKDLNQALSLDENLKKSLQLRGDILIQFGEFDDATTDLRKLQSLQHSAAITRKLEVIRRGKSAIVGIKNILLTKDPTLARCQSARSQLAQLLDVAPQTYEALIFKARCALTQGEAHDALEATRVILQERKRDIAAMYLRARAYFAIGQPELAVKHTKEALKSDPDHRDSKNLFKRVKGMLRARASAQAAKASSQWTDCLAEVARAIELAADEEHYLRELYELQSEAALNGRQYADAVKAASWLIEKDPGHTQAYMWRARANMALEEYNRAKQDFQQVMNRDRGNREANAGYREAEQKAKVAKRKDYYKILGISKDATTSQVRKAYRKLAVLHHPDKQKSDDAKKEAEAKFREINEAYEVLNDQEKRGKYDRGEDLDERGGGGGAHHFHHSGGGFPFGNGFPFGAGGPRFQFRRG